ncbi:hypothetical protein [Metabacillus sp. SLBN-84]
MTYEEKATQYAETYGIVEFEVKGNRMTYTERFPLENAVYAASVNLETMTETRTAL